MRSEAPNTSNQVRSHSMDIVRSVSASASTSSCKDTWLKDRNELPSSMHTSKSESKLQPLLSTVSADTTTSLNTEYRGPIIPPYTDKSFRRRTVILCFDGTGDQFDMDNSNVIQFFSVLKKGDRKRQLVYYQSGIGTYTIPQVATPLWSKIQKTLDLMFASNLDHHVMSGYHFLMQNYKEGDKICLFGFSRGAYTARALAGMIHKVGLLPAGNEQQVPFAYKMYSNDSERGWRQSVAFKRTFCMDIDIDFVGVWDTVASVGLLPHTLPFTKSNTAIKVFRHALSLDEHRVKFKPSIYEKITAEEASRGDFRPPPNQTFSLITRGRKRRKQTDERATGDNGASKKQERSRSPLGRSNNSVRDPPNERTISQKIARQETVEVRRSDSGSRSRAIVDSLMQKARDVSDTFQEVVERVSLDRSRSRSGDDDEEGDNIVDLSPDSERDRLEQMYLDRSKPTDILEVWFAGCHCDVGGGSVSNDTPNSLARIPLRWMIRECFLARTGIQFEAEKLREHGLDPSTLYPKVITPQHPEKLASPSTPPSPPMSAPDTKSGEQEKHRVLKKSNAKQVHSSSKDSSTRRVDMVTSDTKEKMKARDVEVGVEVIESDDNTRSSHRRQNNISMSTTQTLVDSNRDIDGESGDTPHVVIQKASFIQEEINTSSCEEYDTSSTRSNPPASPTSSKHKDKAIHIDIPPASTPSGVKQPKLPVETHSDIYDMRSKVYDQLKLAKWWWILEYIPLRERVQRSDGTWKKKWIIGRGKPRKVHQEGSIMVHRSVKLRMETHELGYKPHMKLNMENVIWVD